MLLEVQNLSHQWEDRKVLQELNFKVKAAKITVILGANGTGKSTLLKLMAGLLDTQSGKILFEGEKVRGPGCMLVPGHPSIALVKQDSRLSPNITVRENLLYVLRAYDEEYQNEKIQGLSKLLNVEPILDRVVNFLSGGEKQRIAIAAALASSPELLLMDEPFSQTDMYLKQELKQYLSQIVEHLGIGLLFVTHDPQDALSLADEIIVLHEGQIVEQGNSHQLYYYPKHRVTATLTGYCSWLPVEKFPELSFLHQVGEDWLIRPDQVRISPMEGKNVFKAKINKIEFLGFYNIVHLQLEQENHSLILTQVSSYPLPKIGEQVSISFV